MKVGWPTRRFVLVLALALAIAELIARAQSPVFRSSVEMVAIHPAVIDQQGRAVTDLNPEEFIILDDGVPAPIALFSSDPQPLSLVLLLDVSASMLVRLSAVREATTALIDLLDQRDRLRIGTFGAEIALSPHFTADRSVLRRIAREEIWPGGESPVWSAIDRAIESFPAGQTRAAILIATDGRDTTNENADAVADRLRQAAIGLHAVGVGGANIDRRMRRLIENTGGSYRRLSESQDVAAAFAQILSELRHQYLIGITPMDRRTTHRLTVKVRRAGLTVRAPTSFTSIGR